MSGQAKVKKIFLSLCVAGAAYVSVVTREPSIVVVTAVLSGYFMYRQPKVEVKEVDQVAEIQALRASLREASEARRREYLAAEKQHLRDVALVSGAAVAAGVAEVEEDSLTDPMYGQVGLGVTDLY